MWSFSLLKLIRERQGYLSDNDKVGWQCMEFLRLLHCDNQFWVEYRLGSSTRAYREPIETIVELLPFYHISQAQSFIFQQYFLFHHLYQGVFQFVPQRLQLKYVNFVLRQSVSNQAEAANQ